MWRDGCRMAQTVRTAPKPERHRTHSHGGDYFGGQVADDANLHVATRGVAHGPNKEDALQAAADGGVAKEGQIGERAWHVNQHLRHRHHAPRRQQVTSSLTTRRWRWRCQRPRRSQPAQHAVASHRSAAYAVDPQDYTHVARVKATHM